MKKASKLISFLIVLTLIVSALPMPVAVAEGEEYAAIALDETVVVSSDDALGNTRYFSFTAQEAGKYSFYSFDNDGLDVCCYVYDSEMNELDYDDDGAGYPNFKSSFELTEGDTVYLKSSPLNSGNEGSYSVKVVKVHVATGISISEESVTGKILGTKRLSATFLPENAEEEEISWTSSDSTVADVDGIYNSGKECDISLLSAGTATITATTESGLTATCEVTVEDWPLIEVESTVVITATEENSGAEVFKFVPEESGTYKFYSYDNDFDTYGHIYDSDLNQIYYDDDDGDGSNFFIQFDAVAGEVYYLKARSYYEETSGEFSISINKLASATSIELSTEAISGNVGSKWDISASFLPENAIEEQITWSSSDETVVKFISKSNDSCQIQLVGEGTATITSTSENGLTDTCTVTVNAPVEITEGEAVEVQCSDDMYNEAYLFVPEETGVYKFDENMNGASYSLSLYNSDFEKLSSSSWMRVELTAGEKYYYTISAEKSESAEYIDFSLTIKHLVPATGITLSETEIKGKVATYKTIDLEFLPENAIEEEITWTSSNEDAVIIYDTWNGGKTCDVKIVGKGSSVITAESESGLTASCTVTADQIVDVKVDETYTRYEEDGYSYTYMFQPEETGTYMFDFTCVNSYIDWIAMYDGNLSWLDEPYGDFQYQFTAGETYYLNPYAYVDYNQDEGDESYISLTVTKLMPAESIVLSQDTITGKLGFGLELELSLIPENSLTEDITWTSSDESIVRLNEWYNDSCYGEFVGVGTATITATNESGLTATCTVTVEEATDISEGEAVQVECWENVYENTFKFVPEEDGIYKFNDDIYNYYSYFVDVYDSDFYHVGYGNQNQLTAGETYYYHVKATRGYQAEPVEGSFEIVKLVPATALTISRDNLKASIGDSYSLYAEFAPKNVIEEEVTWTSSNESVISISSLHYNGMQCYINVCGVGTATITATSENGLTDTCEITVEEPVEIFLGEENTRYVEDGYNYAYKFTPEETGIYLFDFSCVNSYIEWISIYDSTFDWIDECYGDFHYKLTGGETYYFSPVADEEYWDESDESYISLTVTKLVPAESIVLSEESVTEKIGGSTVLDASFTPENAIDEDITWTSSDESVAVIYDTWNDSKSCGIQFVGVGTAIITATSENGLTATCTITVEDVPEITLGDTTLIKDADGFYSGNVNYYKFIPEEDGIYKFTVSGKNTYDEYVYVWNADYDVDVSGFTSVQATLTAGETYYCKASAPIDDYDYTSSATLTIEKLVAPTSLEIDRESYTGTLAQYVDLKVSFGPEGCASEYIEWSSSDNSIARVYNLWDDGYCRLFLSGTGTVTITAESRSGLVDTCTITVNEPSEISLNEEKSVSTDTDGMATGSYKFIPEEDGVYAFYSFDNDYDTYGYVYDSEGNELSYNDDGGEGSNFFATFEATAGEIYYFSARPYSRDAEGEYFVSVKKVIKATSISFKEQSVTSRIGSTKKIYVLFGPDGAIPEGVEFTSSDESVVEVLYNVEDDEGKGCEISFVGVGTATITATSDNGLTATCTVTVEDIPELTLGNTLLVINENGYYSSADNYFKFIPEEDGTYKFTVSGVNTLEESVHLWNDEFDESGYPSLSHKLVAGQTYYVRAYADVEDMDSESSAVITVEKLQPPTSMTLRPEKTTGIISDEITIDVVFGPQGCANEDFSWEISDENILDARSGGEDYVDFFAIGVGEATITFTSDSGLTASCKITISEPGIISLDETKEISTENNCGHEIFKFVPEEDGVYGFYSFDNDFDTYGYVYDSDVAEIERNDDGGDYANFFMQFEAFAGNTYYLKARPYSEESEGTYFVSVKKYDEPTILRLSKQSYSGSILDWFDLDASFGPSGAYDEDVVWTSSNESVAIINYEEGLYTQVRLVGKGTAIITATSESGMVATCTITSEEPEEITLEQGLSLVYKNGYCNKVVKFVPEEDGVYLFNVPVAKTYKEFMLYTEEDVISTSNAKYSSTGEYELNGGEIYYCWVYLSNNAIDSSEAFDFTVSKCSKATTMTLSETSVQKRITEDFELETIFGPNNAASEEVEWTISDTSIVQVDYEGNYSARFNIVGIGTATITATSESGLTATCVVTAMDGIPVVTDSETALSVNSDNGSEVYKFTPDQTATYRIYPTESNLSYSYIRIYNSEFEWINSDNFNEDAFNLGFHGIAGETYYIFFRVESQEEACSCKFKVSAQTAATSLSLMADTLNGSKYEKYYCEYEFEPLNAAREEITWTSSNPDVVRVNNGYLYLDDIGVATITATTPSGLKDSITVTVSEPDELELGVQKTVEKKNRYDTTVFKFIPEASGCYIFESISNVDTYGELLDSGNEHIAGNDDSGDGYNFLITKYLEAGQVYYLSTRKYVSSTITYSVVVTKKLSGDIDDDGDVDVNDYQQLVNFVVSSEDDIIDEYGNEAYTVADINGDGYVDVLDAWELSRIINE